MLREVQYGSIEDLSQRTADIQNVWGIFVGITDYRAKTYYVALPNAARDAAELSQAMVAHCGLQQPELLVDDRANLSDLRAAIRRVAKKAGPNDLFVFHFSGHGQGWRNPQTGALSGLLLLHDAPEKYELRAGHFGSGVLVLDLLDRELQDAGLRAKHRLILLDSCYGGLGAFSRDPDVVLSNSHEADAFRLRRSATYVLSAGGAEQTVSDGPAGGHGLLTSFMLHALAQPDDLRLSSVRVGEREYLPMRAAFAAAESWIPQQAAALAHQRGDTADRSVSDSVREADSSWQQIPQELRRGGEGHIYLPLQRSPSAGSTRPIAPSPAAVSDPTPVSRGSARQLTLGEWSEELGRLYGNERYGAAVRRVFDLLLQGPEPSVAPVKGFAEIELLTRPSVATIQRLLGGKPMPAAACGEGAKLALEESLYRRVRGADWVRIDQLGGCVTSGQELTVFFENKTSSRLYSYILAIDRYGVFQRLAPTGPLIYNSVNERRSLPPWRWQIHPCATEHLGNVMSRGWPVDEGEGEQALIALVSAQPWQELESAIDDAETEWKKLVGGSGFSKKYVDGFELRAALPSRFGGGGALQLADAEAGVGPWPTGFTPLAVPVESEFAGFSWIFRTAREGAVKLELSAGSQ